MVQRCVNFIIIIERLNDDAAVHPHISYTDGRTPFEHTALQRLLTVCAAQQFSKQLVLEIKLFYIYHLSSLFRSGL